MKDYLGHGRFINRPLKNPVQNMFKRFIRQPGSGLPDYLEDTRKKFKDFTSESLRTRFTDMMNEGSE